MMAESRWYIIHAYSGFESKVRDSIIAEAERLGLEQLVDTGEGGGRVETTVSCGPAVASVVAARELVELSGAHAGARGVGNAGDRLGRLGRSLGGPGGRRVWLARVESVAVDAGHGTFACLALDGRCVADGSMQLGCRREDTVGGCIASLRSRQRGRVGGRCRGRGSGGLLFAQLAQSSSKSFLKNGICLPGISILAAGPL